MEKLSFQVAEFEGPLDLILHLISKHKLNIYDIEISKLLEQYLEYVKKMEFPDPEISSDFLEMASRLVQIKTVMLLPRHEEEESRLKQELTGQLLEYAACKEAAAQLRERYDGNSRFIRSPLEFPVDKTFRGKGDPDDLAQAFLLATGKGMRRLPPPAAAFSGIVSRRVVSVTSRIMYLLRRLYKGQKLRMDNLYEKAEDRSEMVATFLAVLELIRAHRAKLNEDGTLLEFNKAGRREPASISVVEEM